MHTTEPTKNVPTPNKAPDTGAGAPQENKAAGRSQLDDPKGATDKKAEYRVQTDAEKPEHVTPSKDTKPSPEAEKSEARK